jgi:hypothetical protein
MLVGLVCAAVWWCLKVGGRSVVRWQTAYGAALAHFQRKNGLHNVQILKQSAVQNNLQLLLCKLGISADMLNKPGMCSPKHSYINSCQSSAIA